MLVSFVLAAAGTASCNGTLTSNEVNVCDESPGALYEKRVAPLLLADHPNTCAQCHAGGLDLEQFLRTDACESMACLRAQGLVDLSSPESSVLLAWIERAKPDSKAITQKTIDEERAGFLEWIEHEAACGACEKVECPDRDLPTCAATDDLSRAYDEETDPGDCEQDTLDRLFRGTVYEWRGRCYPCHFQEEKDVAPKAPRWATQLGTCETASLFTQRHIVDAGYIDEDEPTQSLFLLKPLAESDGGVPHGGHDKFVLDGDPGYDAFAHWVTRYAACAKAGKLD